MPLHIESFFEALAVRVLQGATAGAPSMVGGLARELVDEELRSSSGRQGAIGRFPIRAWADAVGLQVVPALNALGLKRAHSRIPLIGVGAARGAPAEIVGTDLVAFPVAEGIRRAELGRVEG